MKYHELNHTTPFNYRPDDDSAKFFLPEDKVDKFRRLWKKHNRKQKQTRKEDDFTAPEPISVAQQNDNSNLIMVGGLVGESNLDRYKHIANVAKQIWTGATILNEDAASFVVFRSDTNQVLARGVVGYEAAKTKAKQLRKKMDLRFDQVKFKIEKLPPSRKHSGNRSNYSSYPGARYNYARGLSKRRGLIDDE